MIKLGLTGSMGMGKTTTASMFARRGVPVFDADGAVHELYAKGGKGAALIAAVFPDAIKDGAVARKVLSRRLAEDPLNLPVLESFIHPMVAQKRAQFVRAAQEAGADIVLFDSPLLFETGEEKEVDKVIVVSASKAAQRARISARAGMSAAKMDMLLARQMPDLQKRKRADYIIWTDRGLKAAQSQVDELIKSLRQNTKRA